MCTSNFLGSVTHSPHSPVVKIVVKKNDRFAEESWKRALIWSRQHKPCHKSHLALIYNSDMPLNAFGDLRGMELDAAPKWRLRHSKVQFPANPVPRSQLAAPRLILLMTVIIYTTFSSTLVRKSLYVDYFKYVMRADQDEQK